MSELTPSLSEVGIFISSRKEITGKIRWKTTNGNLKWQAVLIGDDGIVIPQARVILTANPDEQLYKFTFILFYRGLNVRRLDIDDTHVRTNPAKCTEYGGEKVVGNHLHLWDAENADQCVVPVNILASVLFLTVLYI